MLAELLEQGMRSTLTIPVHKFMGTGLVASQALNTNNLRGSTQTTPLELESMRSLGINPSHALQHPGFYYYMAAKCTEMRRERFLTAMEAEVCADSYVYDCSCDFRCLLISIPLR